MWACSLFQIEKGAKTLVFLSMSISLVGAGVIFKFMYSAKFGGVEQIGLLNAIVTSFGFEPQNWLGKAPWNNLFLIAIFVWLQTGFAMVVLSAALKAVPEEMLEAARIDGGHASVCDYPDSDCRGCGLRLCMAGF